MWTVLVSAISGPRRLFVSLDDSIPDNRRKPHRQEYAGTLRF